MAAPIFTHKASGWTRQPCADGSGCQRIVPTDASGERIVRFMSAGSWANDPADDKARQYEDRIVLVGGAALPDWAVTWLEAANLKRSSRARQNFHAMIDRADMDRDARVWGA
jgi:hypothetical protein